MGQRKDTPHVARLWRRTALGLVGWLSLSTVVLPAAGGQSAPTRLNGAATRAVPAEVRAAVDFVYLAYPDLVGRPLTIAINPAGGHLALSVSDTVDPIAQQGRPSPEPLLTADVVFAKTGELQSYAAQGPLVERARNDVFADTLHAHPGWTESDAEIAYVAMGGRPRATAPPLGSIDHSKLAPYVGVVATETSNLQLRAAEDGGTSRLVTTPGWVTALETTAADGTPQRYRFVFEPFGGRLVMVTRE